VSEKTSTSPKEQPKDRSFRVRFLGIAVVFLIAGFAVVLVMIFRPQDLSDISKGADPAQPMVARDLNKVFSESISGAYAIRVSEEEINAYLAQTLELKQEGAAAGWVRLEKVLVRLEDNRAEVIMVRKIGDWDFTISMWVAVNQTENARGEVETLIELDGGPMPFFSFVDRGGRFGSLVVPQGFLHLVRPAFIALAEQYPEEIRSGFEEMSRIRMEKDALVLDPRFDQS
jgi:hypothetical protein